MLRTGTATTRKRIDARRALAAPRVRRVAATLLALALGAAASASTPASICTNDLITALAASSPELELRSADVARREGELRLAELGLSTTVSVTTGLEVGANLLRDEEPTWGHTVQMEAGFRYRYDDVAIIRARNALTTAERREAAQKRADVLSALLSLSRLRAAERLSARTGVTAAEAESLAASVRESAITAYTGPSFIGTPQATDEEQGWEAAAPDVALNIRELDLAAAKARATATGRADEAAAARAELARLGVHLPGGRAHAPNSPPPGPAECLALHAAPPLRTTGPTLPRPSPFDTPERRLLVHAVDLSEAQFRRTALGPVRDLSMTAHYQDGSARVLAEVELDGARPAAGVNLRWRDSAARNWGVGVSATLRLDDTVAAAVDAAAAQLETAQAALHRFDETFMLTLTNELAAVDSAWLQLAFAAEAVSIALGRLELAEDDTGVARAQQVLERSVDALEREYQTYLRAVGRYLGAFDIPWAALTGP